MAEKFLITGGQGFIGSWIARQLLLEGVEFAIFDRSPGDAILEQILAPGALPRLVRYYGDIANGQFVLEVVKKSRATRIIHLAGLQVPACRSDPVAGAMVNVVGTLNVFEAARMSGKVEMVTYASSAAVAGTPDDYEGPIADDARHVPRTHYGVFKTTNEGNGRIYYQDHGIPSVGLRPLAVYGVGREIGITSGPTKAIKAAILDRSFTIGFTGTTGFSYASDVAQIFIACARANPKAALALNLRGQVATVEDFIKTLEEVVPGARGKITCAGNPIPVAYDFQERGLESLLGPGNIPTTPIHRGIRSTAESFRGLAREGRLHDRDLSG